MENLKSGIVLKDRIFVPDYDDYYKMLEELGLEDTVNAPKNYVCFKLSPIDNDIFTNVDDWELTIIQDNLPDWWNENEYKQMIYKTVKDWAFNHIHINEELIISEGTHYSKNCIISAWGNSNIIAFDNSVIRAYIFSIITAYDNTTVTAYYNTTVTAFDKSTVTAFDKSTVTAFDKSTVTAYGYSTVMAFDKSTVTAFDNSTVTAYGYSTVMAFDKSTVTAFDNSTITTYNNLTVKTYDKSTVTNYKILALKRYVKNIIDKLLKL